MVSLTRRSFLACSAAALFASDVPRRDLTLGFSTYGMPKMPTTKAVALIGKIGFDSAELAILPDRDLAPEKATVAVRKAVREALATSNVKLTALMDNLTPSIRAKVHNTTLEHLKRAGDLAGDLSSERPALIETVLGGGKWEGVRNIFRDRLGDWVRILAAKKVVLAIKPHRFGAMSLPEHAIWLIEQLGNTPWLRMVFDYSHYALRGFEMGKLIDQAARYTAFVAVKDVEMEKGKAVFRLPGTTKGIDYPDQFQRLHKAGYRGDINCEVSGQVFSQKGYDPEKAARTCYVNMNAALKKAKLR